jgi:hypothetical protein
MSEQERDGLPPPCDPEVMRKGATVMLEGRNPGRWEVEAWVKKVAQESGQQVDWHYAAGWVHVLALGDIEAVAATITRLKPEYYAACQKEEDEMWASLGRPNPRALLEATPDE